MELSVTYILHDCFVVSLGDIVLLFDYSAILNDIHKQIVINKVQNKRLLAFITHSHKDHFSKDLFFLSEYVKDFKCIVSKDVAELCSECTKICNVVDAGNRVSIGEILVRVYGSTDLGVSYIIEVNGIQLYFSGDNTDWRRPSLLEDVNEQIRKTFELVVNELKKKEGHVDILFANFCTQCERYGGIDVLCNTLKPNFLVPMHLNGDTKLLKTYYDYLIELAPQVFIYENPGDTINIDKKEEW